MTNSNQSWGSVTPRAGASTTWIAGEAPQVDILAQYLVLSLRAVEPPHEGLGSHE